MPSQPPSAVVLVPLWCQALQQVPSHHHSPWCHCDITRPSASPFPPPLFLPPSCPFSLQHGRDVLPSPAVSCPSANPHPRHEHGQGICGPEKASSLRSLLRLSPPGEFSLAVRDLFALAQGDRLVRQEAAWVGDCHSKHNFSPTQINGHTVWLTRYNGLGGNRCGVWPPAWGHQQSQLYSVVLHEGERRQEPLPKGLTPCIAATFHTQGGDGCVFKQSPGKTQLFVASVEFHQYQPSPEQPLKVRLDFWPASIYQLRLQGSFFSRYTTPETPTPT